MFCRIIASNIEGHRDIYARITSWLTGLRELGSSLLRSGR